MASALKSKISQATSSALSPDPALKHEAEKYRLLVTAGPSYDLSTHKPIHVNTEQPTFIENDFLRAKINVRIKGFRGLPSSCPSTSEEYFSDPMHHKDQYSLGFSFVPKQDIPSLNTVWGNDLDHPIRDKIPPGFNTAFRIVKEFIDPGLSCDVYADEPWLYGPSLSCWFAFRIGPLIGENEDFPAPSILHEGADGQGHDIRDHHSLPSNNEKRRKHFLSAPNRERFIFEKGRLYQADFYNPYLDFANFALKLPGFSLKVVKYIGEKTHCLRYVFKDRESGDVYFNVNFTLLWGDELEKALEREKRGGGVVENGQENHENREGDDGDEEYHSADDGKEAVAATRAGVEKMQLHPGDHNAAAEGMIERNGVDEIDRMLRDTSSSQKRSGTFLDDVD